MKTNNPDKGLRLGIRAKLSFPLLAGLLLTTVILIYIWQPSQLEQEKQQYIHNQENIIKTLVPVLLEQLLKNDLSAIHSTLLFASDLHRQEWKYLQLVNNRGELLYPLQTTKPNELEKYIKLEMVLSESSRSYGSLTLYIDWSHERKLQEEEINEMMWLFIFSFAVLIITKFVLQTMWVHTPIVKLNNFTRQLAQENYDLELPKPGSDELGELAQSIGYLREKIKTGLRELRERDKLRGVILDTAPDAIISLDEYGTVQSYNKGAEKMFQYTAVEVIGKNVSMLMTTDIAKVHDKYISSFQDMETSTAVGKRRELVAVRRNGSEFPIELVVNVSYIDDKKLFTGFLRDISHKKEMEKLKGEFVSTVSHELRTPLTAIKGSLSLVQYGLGDNVDAKTANLLDVTQRNVERLSYLIDDILHISKLESDAVEFELKPLLVTQFLQVAIEINQEYAVRHNTLFELGRSDPGLCILVDENRLMQAISNIMSNAAKFSPPQQAVVLSTWQLDEYTIRIMVSDNGPGIPQSFQAIMFEKFTQADMGDTRQVGGTGLGLNIAKAIVEKMQGKIGFFSEEGKGTSFYFDFPVFNE